MKYKHLVILPHFWLSTENQIWNSDEFSFTFTYVDWDQCFFFFFNLPSMIWTHAKDLFEKDGPNLSDFIFQNTHFLSTTYYLHIH